MGPLVTVNWKRMVLKKIPKAFAHPWKDCWVIYLPDLRVKGVAENIVIGQGTSERLAWWAAAAAMDLDVLSFVACRTKGCAGPHFTGRKLSVLVSKWNTRLGRQEQAAISLSSAALFFQNQVK